MDSYESSSEDDIVDSLKILKKSKSTLIDITNIMMTYIFT